MSLLNLCYMFRCVIHHHQGEHLITCSKHCKYIKNIVCFIFCNITNVTHTHNVVKSRWFWESNMMFSVSCKMGTGSFPGVKGGRGVTLTPYILLVPWSRNSRATPLLPLSAVRPAQCLCACTRVHLYLTLPIMSVTTKALTFRRQPKPIT